MSTLGVIAEEEGECWPSKQSAGEFGRADAPADWHRVMSGLLELLPADVQDANAALVSQALRVFSIARLEGIEGVSERGRFHT